MAQIEIKLKQRMQEQNVKAYSLARQANVPESSVKNILYGKSKRPRSELVLALADKLHCSPSDLFSDDDPRAKGDYSFHSLPNKSWDGKLHLEAMQAVYKISVEEDLQLSEKKATDLANKIYNYASDNGDMSIDLKFARWLLTHNS